MDLLVIRLLGGGMALILIVVFTLMFVPAFKELRRNKK